MIDGFRIRSRSHSLSILYPQYISGVDSDRADEGGSDSLIKSYQERCVIESDGTPVTSIVVALHARTLVLIISGY